MNALKHVVCASALVVMCAAGCSSSTDSPGSAGNNGRGGAAGTTAGNAGRAAAGRAGSDTSVSGQAGSDAEGGEAGQTSLGGAAESGGAASAGKGGALGGAGAANGGGTANGGGGTANAGAANGGGGTANAGGGTANGGGGTANAGAANGGGGAANAGAANGGGGAANAGAANGGGGAANAGAANGGGGAANAGAANGGAGGSGAGCGLSVAGGSSVAGVVWPHDFEATPYDGIEGTWAVDNSLAQAGTKAIHPPLKTGTGGTDEMAIKCGGNSHSELSFWVAGINPTAAQQLKLYVDDVLYTTFGKTNDCCHNFNKVDMVVPTGTHRYRFVASTDVAGQSPYWIDSIQCSQTPTALNTSGSYNFEEGFVAPELTGNFQIDNGLPQAGIFAAHPPLSDAPQKSVLNFSCGCKANAGISFWYALVNPPAGQDLKFFVDNQLYATYSKTNDCCHNFDNKVIDLPSGHHDYRWEISTTAAGQPPLWIDSIKCQ